MSTAPMTPSSAGPAPASRTLRVLLVQDTPAEAESTADVLRDGLPDTVVQHVRRLADALDVVRREACDVVLVAALDPMQETDVEALRALQAAGAETGAALVLTGEDEERVGQATLAAGAQDHLVTGSCSPELLARTVRCAVSRARAERDAATSRAWAQGVLDSLEAPTCAVDPSGTIVAVNAAWTRFGRDNGGQPERTGIGVSYLSVCDASPDPADRVLAADLRRLLQTGSGRVVHDYSCSSPTERRWFSLRATAIAGGGGALLTHSDATALHLAHEQLDFAAWHDPLTGLVTRHRLTQELDRRLRSVEPGRTIAVLSIGLDRFQLINEMLGHDTGDGVLLQVGENLRAAVRQGDVVGRQGGDEFVVLADLRGDEVDVLADRLQAATNQRLRIGDVDVDVTASVGMAVTRADHGDTADDVLQAVAHAMHQAKAAGHGRVEFHTDELRARARSRAQLFRELTVALEQEQFVLHFQPIVVPDAGGIHAAEALIRWQHPQRGLLGPAEFLPVAESTGLIVPIGSWVLQAACQQGQRLHEAGLHLSITVNLSAKQLADPQTVAVISRALTSSGFAPHSLVIEITETSMIDDTDLALTSMRAIKALGVQLAVDDFGTGYSSMDYIRRYPVDGLKIDRSFVRDMLTNSDDRAIVTSLIAFARDLDLWVIAEGVETQEQLETLQAIGPVMVQGFLYSRPMPAHELAGSALLLAERARVVVRGTPAGPPRRAAAPGVDAALVARIAELRGQGMSLATVAAALNSEGHRTPRGLRWHHRSVARAMGTPTAPALDQLG